VRLTAFFEALAANPPVRVRGTGVFMTARDQGAPPILVHHLTHNKVLHEQVIFLTVTIVEVPTVPASEMVQVEQLREGFFRVLARFGYMQPPDVPMALERARAAGLVIQPGDTSYYLATLTLFANARLGMSRWRDKLFIFLSRNARRATNFFRIPPDRVVEIGIQLEI
jgi:KUP system potassium uptake protein